MEKIRVLLGEHSYPITISYDLLNSCNVYSPLNSGEYAMIITNKKLYSLYGKHVQSTLSKIGVKINKVILPDGEKYKSLTTVNTIFTALLKHNHPKTTTLIALGGGVIGDLAGFTATCYKRGVRLIQVPTTLLSQVDASIGGKTAINHALGKNIIGTFYQPTSVIIDLNTLKTLPKRQFSSGLAEIIKYGIILDNIFFSWLEKNMKYILANDKEKIAYCIQHCCKLKAKIVAKDEKEINGERVLLNLGHTFGHAIEIALGYGIWLHGEAIAVGIVMAAKTAELIGKLSNYDTKRIINLLQKANLPTKGPEKINPETYFHYMMKDKKILDKKINLVLPQYIGKAKLYFNINNEIILEAIKACI
ncbi:3-dehydroquinate synthase [Arsenophonus symbiont of Ornithomya chloropus]|uniref:3-dehydroquinate synthase n=1 Tax=Arsenophonus symbiont of Ornithomya chloropus TaxID=634121 RepID=UPI0032B1AAC4